MPASGGPSRPTQPLGFVYEIVPDDDPTVGSAVFRGRVLHEGEPLAGRAGRGDACETIRLCGLRRAAMRDGAFSFVLPRAGVWLIKSVHLVHASLFSDADWDSLWASLTFELPEPQAPPDVRSSR